MVFQELLNYLIQSKIDKRLESIETDISELKTDVNILKGDVKEIKTDMNTNFRILFNHLSIPLPPNLIDMPVIRDVEKSENPVVYEIDTRAEYQTFESNIAFGPNASHEFKIDNVRHELHQRKRKI